MTTALPPEMSLERASPAVTPRSPWSPRMVRTIGLSLLGGLALVALLAPWIARYDPTDFVGPSLVRPSAEHWLGTNDVGQDIFSRLVYGARVSLGVGGSVALLATLLGTTVGLVAGYLRGPVDVALMRLVDVVLALPFLPLLIVLQVFLGTGLTGLVLVLVLVMWARPARELRSRVLSSRERTHVQAAQLMGATRRYVMRRHLLPDLTPLIIPQFVRIARAAILSEASLSFLGLGDPTATTWGAMLFHAQARSAYLTGAWVWWILPPGVLIGLTVLGVALVGYSLEESSRPMRVAAWSAKPKDPGQVTFAVDAADATTSLPVLRLVNLTVDYGVESAPALDRVSLTVERREIVGLVGESGSGKSTLAACAMSLLQSPGVVRSGGILVDGQNVARLDTKAARKMRGKRVALVPQSAQNSLNPVRSAFHQVLEALAAHHTTGPDAHDRARALLESVDLKASHHFAYPHELSGGMRQRVLIAMALANDPDLLIADEPTTGLDLITQKAILELLAKLRNERNLALLLISHDLRTVLEHVDRVIVLKGGGVVEVAAPADFGRGPKHAYSRRLLSALPPPLERGLVPRGANDGRRTPNGPAVLTLTAVTRTYRSRRGAPVAAVRDLSLSIHRGEVVGVVGPSGAGKSTLARLAAGLERPDAGSVSGRGDPGRLERARHVHLLFQDPYASLAPHLRTSDVVGEPLVIRGVDREEVHDRVVNALQDCGLERPHRFLQRYPHELSGGERQRVALARAIIVRPAVLVADEPASLLDAPLRADLLELLYELTIAHELALLYITHDLAAAAGFCDRIVVLSEGCAVEEGPTRMVLGDPQHVTTRQLIAAGSMLARSPVGPHSSP